VKKFFLSLSVLLLIAFVLAPTSAFSAEAPDEESADARDPQRVLARVEGHEIREEHVDQLLSAAGPQAMMLYNNEQGRKMVLDELIASRLFALSGKRQGLDESPEFQSLLDSFITHSISRLAIENTLNDVVLSDEDLRNFYDENQSNFVSPDQIRAKHILIADNEEAEEKLAFIQGELENGVAFDALATEHSIDPSAQRNGGDLGFFGRGQMVPEFEAAAFALNEPGDISEPVKSNFGWHIILLEEKKPSSAMPFDEVRPQIEQFLLNEKRTQRYQEALEALKSEFTVEILTPESD